MNQHAVPRFAFVSILMLSALSFAQQAAPAQDPPKDTITRIFTNEFSERPSPPPRWFDGGQSYIAMEPAGGGHGRDVVKYDTATGKNREVLITAAQLTPEGAKEPLQIAGLSWSKDNQRVLVFTNTRRVWRTNSRGDYWLFDRKSGKLRKLGGDAPEASLMYAKFNPDASKVAYVRNNDIYVQDLGSEKIQQITHDGSALVINGGSDWVNEEELDLHDCFRWSPDGKQTRSGNLTCTGWEISRSCTTSAKNAKWSQMFHIPRPVRIRWRCRFLIHWPAPQIQLYAQA